MDILNPADPITQNASHQMSDEEMPSQAAKEILHQDNLSNTKTKSVVPTEIELTIQKSAEKLKEHVQG